ncbi:MAG TPA: phytanoyl-CoA dioxygenase family protein, partial [Fimbriimonadaceae bacterium]|nr:phytanoyl-CoA dioxygenase family protein [Fimbriimonadaceae bacterium]
MSDKLMELTPAQIRSFHLDGFLAVGEPVASASELEWLRGVYDRLFEQRAGREAGDQFDLAGVDDEQEQASLPQILNPAKYAPELESGHFLAAANAIVRQLLGESVSVGIAHAIFKPAGQGAPTPWHQDEAYWDPAKSYCAVSVWMPLQEATVENGCLWFLPGSHRWPVLPHRSIGGDVRIHGLELARDVDLADAVACPLPPGGLTIHLNRTAHYAG